MAGYVDSAHAMAPRVNGTETIHFHAGVLKTFCVGATACRQARYSYEAQGCTLDKRDKATYWARKDGRLVAIIERER